MAQRPLAQWFLDRMEVEGTIFSDEKQRLESTLRRMGLCDSVKAWEPLRWELLAWFVDFAQRDLSNATPEEGDALESQLWVVKKLSALNLNPEEIDRVAAVALQQKVRAVLTQLVDNNFVRLGPFPIETVIYRGEKKLADLPASQRAIGVALAGRTPLLVGQAPYEGIAFDLPPSGPDAVMHCLRQLLCRFPGAVRRCPRSECGKLFAQLRKSAVYCSRTCQSVMAAREYREAKRKEEEAKRKRSDETTRNRVAKKQRAIRTGGT